MSTGQLSRHRSQSSASKTSASNRHIPPASLPTPENDEFEPCAATGSFFLLAQRNVILCLHHDTLAIERRFDKHREDVQWIAVDNVSERGSGRMAVSYDAGNTAIVWDIHTGREIARFAAYEHIRVAVWMRNGNIAFGNVKGNVILFEPSTSEHISARTIFDPITALAPASDCSTYAIGYLNGSILVARTQPSFTILHTLTTSRGPSRVTELAWHGSSSKQKSEMLATQTSDGDLRVWSIPKTQDGDSPAIIRILNVPEAQQPPGPCWFAWSKNGRVVQHSHGETRSWDVRTKKVTHESVPTVDGITGIANHGPTSTLFTLGRNHTIQQYDVNPEGAPVQVANVQHFPAKTPPSPPNSMEEKKDAPATATAVPIEGPVLPTFSETEGSESENNALSPLQKLSREMDQLEDERRDRLAPLSPSSSRTSSVSSRSSGVKKGRDYLYDKPWSSRGSNISNGDGTEFSMGQSLPKPRESMSIRSSTSYRSSGLRKEIVPSPEDAQHTQALDLFPFCKARLLDVKFRTPYYGQNARTPAVLRREMLSVVFGWDDDIELLIRDEMSRHPKGSGSAVLLAKWLGDLHADNLVSMVGSESMTSSDWMLLALSSIGKESQKKVGEAFVQRLLEKGDIHPAVAILLGLGEQNDAIEAYVSQKFYMEALLLTCLILPSDWQRQSYLLRKWGEVAVTTGSAELAVRCFSCTSIETTEAWFSPRAQDAVYAAQKEHVLGPASMSPPNSPPSATGSNRMTAKNAALKLITTFGEKGIPTTSLGGDDPTPMNTLGAGITPIAQSALSPGGVGTWLRSTARKDRDPSSARSARTATPGAYSRKRIPSRGEVPRSKTPSETPLTAARDFVPAEPSIPHRKDSGTPHSRMHSRKPSSAALVDQTLTLSPHSYQPRDRKASGTHLPSPAAGTFSRLMENNHSRNGSRDRMPDGMHLQFVETAYLDSAASPGPTTTATTESGLSTASSLFGRHGTISPPLTGGSLPNVKGKAIDPYISSLEQAKMAAREQRSKSKSRVESRERKAREDRSESRGRPNVRYIPRAKRSPSSPVPMSPDEVLAATRADSRIANERHDSVTSPIEPPPQTRSRSDFRPTDLPQRAPSRATSRKRSPGSQRLGAGRGRSHQRKASAARSPSSPLPMSPEMAATKDDDETQSDGQRVRLRSASRLPQGKQLPQTDSATGSLDVPASTDEDTDNDPAAFYLPRLPIGISRSQATSRNQDGLTRKQLAAKELEERRMSLARRPSAPAIPMPGQQNVAQRPSLGPRYNTDLGDSPTSFMPPMSGYDLSRSQSVDPDAMVRFTPKTTGTSTPTAPIGLPATPRAMMHPRYMAADPNERDGIPKVPQIPEDLATLAPAVFQGSRTPANEDQLAPLLPSTAFGQRDFQPPARAASAPLERNMDGMPTHRAYKAALPPSYRRNSVTRTHTRRQSNEINSLPTQQQYQQHSPPLVTASIDETIRESSIIIVEENSNQPPMLPELQHLASPPPPPPAPNRYSASTRRGSLGVINIAIDESAPLPPSTTTTPAPTSAVEPSSTPILPQERAATSSPSTHRRGRGSISDTSTTNVSISTRIRNVTERMRSTSRGASRNAQNKSPSIGYPTSAGAGGGYPGGIAQAPSPYETVLAGMPGRGYGDGGHGNLGHGGQVHGSQGVYRRDSYSNVVTRAKSPYESSIASTASGSVSEFGAAAGSTASTSTTGGQTGNSTFSEHSIPPEGMASMPGSRSASAMGVGGVGYVRHPKEVRANMPPEILGKGVYTGASNNNGVGGGGGGSSGQGGMI